jgi:ParB-like chromosome segregation protein Spo0J
MARAKQKPKQTAQQQIHRQPPQRIVAVNHADKYCDLIPTISEPDFQALKASIAEKGLLSAIVVDNDGAIVDGHSRWRAIQELKAEGIKVEHKIRRLDSADETTVRSYIRAVNFARRHLTTKQKRNLIKAQLIDNPTDSDRKIAAMLGVDHKTVGDQREELAAGGEIPQVAEHTGQDGKTYSKPTAKRPAKADAADLGKDDHTTPPPRERMRRPRREETEPVVKSGQEPVNSGQEPNIEAEPIRGIDLTGDDAGTQDAAMFAATRSFLGAVHDHATACGRSASIHDVANAAHDWVNASLEQLDWSAHKFAAWLDEIET